MGAIPRTRPGLKQRLDPLSSGVGGIIPIPPPPPVRVRTDAEKKGGRKLRRNLAPLRPAPVGTIGSPGFHS